jgi:site-specific DNA-cytosine methylase
MTAVSWQLAGANDLQRTTTHRSPAAQTILFEAVTNLANVKFLGRPKSGLHARMPMNLVRVSNQVEFTFFCGFCGPGGGAMGFLRGDPRVGNLRASFRCLGGFDVDPKCVRDFTRLVGIPATLLDLFDRQQFIDFHGVEPPPGWREATPADIRRAAGNQSPNIVFLSPPCKGFSGLLSAKLSLTPKYQALNRLTLRGVWLMLEAFADDTPEFFLLENVPRIQSRGRDLLDQIVSLFNTYGYAVAEKTHDCGELGELAQSRKRFLLVARHAAKVPPFLYQPPTRPLRAVGDILSRLPLPGDPAGGVMHRIPQLQWQTWVRLAFIEAGSDWRSLNRLRVIDGKLADYLIVPQVYADGLGVAGWSDTLGAVTASALPTTGRFSVADPRQIRERHKNVFRVVRWNQETGAITSGHGPTNGGGGVADPRPQYPPTFVKYPVTGWHQSTGAVIGGDDAGAYSVSDMRAHGPFRGKGKYCVTAFNGFSNTVIGASTTGHGAFSVSDPGTRARRTTGDAYHTAGGFGVTRWDSPSNAVAGAACYDNGPWSVAEPRDCLPLAREKLIAYILSDDGTWHRPFTTYELAALQNLFEPGEAFELDGKSDSRWREAIGNCVPPAAAKALADVMGTTLLLAKTGQTFMLSSQPIWVRPLARAISVKVPILPDQGLDLNVD